MLILISGTYGVGKSYLIESLQIKISAKVIATYVTRTSRKKDFGRIVITDEQFDLLERQDKFISINKHFEKKYGILKGDIKTAVNDKAQVYILDFPISKIGVFADFMYKLIVVNPPSIDYLRKTLLSAGRGDRINIAQKDFEENYLTLSSNLNCLVIVNDFENFNENETKILDFIKS